MKVIQIQYLKGQAGIYFGKLGRLIHEVCTNYYTFSRALKELEQEGLITCKHMVTNHGIIKVVRITEDCRKMVSSSLLLLRHISA